MREFDIIFEQWVNGILYGRVATKKWFELSGYTEYEKWRRGCLAGKKGVELLKLRLAAPVPVFGRPDFFKREKWLTMDEMVILPLFAGVIFSSNKGCEELQQLDCAIIRMLECNDKLRTSITNEGAFTSTLLRQLSADVENYYIRLKEMFKNCKEGERYESLYNFITLPIKVHQSQLEIEQVISKLMAISDVARDDGNTQRYSSCKLAAKRILYSWMSFGDRDRAYDLFEEYFATEKWAI